MITQVTAAAMTMNNAQCRNLSGGLQTVILAGMWSPCRSLASVRTDGIPAIRGCGCAAADDKIQDGSPEWNGDPAPSIRAGRGRGCAWVGGRRARRKHATIQGYSLQRQASFSHGKAAGRCRKHPGLTGSTTPMSHTRKRLVMGNWKMHGSLAANAALLEGLVAGATRAGDAQLAVCVPFPYLAQARDALAGTPVSWGAQDVSVPAQGAYTGEVAPAMLADFGCAWTLCGHSERRAMHGESSALVAARAASALAAGLTPVVCVGETLDDRDAGQVEC